METVTSAGSANRIVGVGVGNNTKLGGIPRTCLPRGSRQPDLGLSMGMAGNRRWQEAREAMLENHFFPGARMLLTP